MYWIIILAIILYFYFDKRKYDKSGYKTKSGNSYIQTKFNKGYNGEYETYEKLRSLNTYHKILTNLYVPMGENKTTEIDLIFLHETGIYVLESKNYSGWIFGNEKNKQWTQCFRQGRKEHFYNPIWQNKTHIKYLSKFLGEIDIRYFKSLIVFSERCILKKIDLYSDNIKVINRYDLIQCMKYFINQTEKVMTRDKIEEIYNKLIPLTNVSKNVKMKHITDINAYINQ